MIRLAGLAFLVAAICVCSWRDRFLALCGLLLLSVVSQHPSAPTEIAGIPGLNAWNVALGGVLVAWIVQRRSEPAPPAPLWLGLLAGAYVLMLVAGAARTLLDLDTIVARGELLFPVCNVRTTGDAVKDLIINPCKFILVGYLLYDTCKTSRRAWYAILTVMLLGLAYALLMYKSMKMTVFTGNYEDARRLTDKLIGLHANDLAGLLTMAFWLCVTTALILPGRWRAFGIGAAVLILPAIVGCHSRAAYLANAAIVLVLALVRWRWLLLATPVALLFVVFAFPQISQRLGMGLDSGAATPGAAPNWNEVTAGRTHNIWEPVIAEIGHAPLFGYGRLAIARTGATHEIHEREGYVPTHPHNSYLELLLDGGLMALGVTLALLLGIGHAAFRLVRSRGQPLQELAGALGLIAVVNAMVLGLSSQFLYPKQSLMWLVCAVAITGRVWGVVLSRRRAAPSWATRANPRGAGLPMAPARP
jgi:O-antigen ligase